MIATEQRNKIDATHDYVFTVKAYLVSMTTDSFKFFKQVYDCLSENIKAKFSIKSFCEIKMDFTGYIKEPYYVADLRDKIVEILRNEFKFSIISTTTIRSLFVEHQGCLGHDGIISF